MTYLDPECLRRLDTAAFRAAKPYPWVNPQGLLTERGFAALRDSAPDLSLFEPHFGVERKFGQASHDYHNLEYRERLNLPEPWKEFIAEFRDAPYRRFLRRLLGTRFIQLGFHWHYTPRGCSVSPHCDAKRKLGSHLFYLNDEKDWDPAWGGSTILLDDGARIPRESAPKFEEFLGHQPAEILGNRSLLFTTRGHSWHGVRDLECPEGALRKVFIVVIYRGGPRAWIKRQSKSKRSALY